MRQILDFSLDQLVLYLAKPDSQRPFKRYREELLDPEPAFTREEVKRLMSVVRMEAPHYPKFSISKLLIDLSWASSHLEGNTYTQLDTQVLIEYGKQNKDKPAEDAAMILNHKRAIEMMVANPVLSEETVLAMHKALADNSMAQESRHFLEQSRCGCIRSYTATGLHIHGSSYLPAQAEDRPPGYLNREFHRLIDAANALPDPVNQSFYILTRLPYLQPFYDVNKRTSRISCNIPLVANGLSPLSFVDFDKRCYLEGLIAFYELGDERLARNAYLDAYLSSAFRYLPFSEGAHFAMTIEWDKHVAAARRYVVDGQREARPVWLQGLPRAGITDC